jgi:hypothetical protein
MRPSPLLAIGLVLLSCRPDDPKPTMGALGQVTFEVDGDSGCPSFTCALDRPMARGASMMVRYTAVGALARLPAGLKARVEPAEEFLVPSQIQFESRPTESDSGEVLISSLPKTLQSEGHLILERADGTVFDRATFSVATTASFTVAILRRAGNGWAQTQPGQLRLADGQHFLDVTLQAADGGPLRALDSATIAVPAAVPSPIELRRHVLETWPMLPECDAGSGKSCRQATGTRFDLTPTATGSIDLEVRVRPDRSQVLAVKVE